MSESLHAAAAKVGEPSIDTEHDLQMQLLDSLSQALRKGDDPPSVKYVLEQFIEFSDMHFLSEQLVMRLHGYPAYEIHLREHTRLMKRLREIREIVFRGEQAPSIQLIDELRGWLLAHIAREDGAFGEYLKKKNAKSL
jgi:hemerythrin